jgi:hypothetical protein
MSPTVRKFALIGIAGGTAALGAVAPTTTFSQPSYSVASANSCNTCHVEPVGWANPDKKADRRCSLSCQSCHISPTGGGMRTPAGLFYGTQTLPGFGQNAAYDEGEHGGFRLGQGFAGWAPGSTAVDGIDDRYGEIEADPTFRAGGDARFMGYFPDSGDSAFFPMQGELYLFAEPADSWWLYADAGLRSSRSEFNLFDLGLVDDTISYFRVRELFAMKNDLPGNSYVRIGRFAPPYGWRLPDHTSYIRRDLGFDQDRQVFGVEGGWNPNYPYLNGALYYQGIEGWPGDSGNTGYGLAATAGIRELAWQAGGSIDALVLDAGGSELRIGPQWALNSWPLAYLGEVDVKNTTGDLAATGLYGYHELRWFAPYGLQPRIKWDWKDGDISLADDHANRFSFGLQFDPIRYAQLDLQYRVTAAGGDILALHSSVSTDFLAQLHGWF